MAAPARGHQNLVHQDLIAHDPTQVAGTLLMVSRHSVSHVLYLQRRKGK
jgi:hypothetical protein